jgi:hypothetical protein
MYTENMRNGTVCICRIHESSQNLNISLNQIPKLNIFQLVNQDSGVFFLAQPVDIKISHATNSNFIAVL